VIRELGHLTDKKLGELGLFSLETRGKSRHFIAVFRYLMGQCQTHIRDTQR